MLSKDYFSNVHGAVYFPSRAYNAYQTYLRFSSKECDRDFSYAEKIGVNALRIFTSYEFWKESSELFYQRFDQMLISAEAHGIRVMPVLFEDCGCTNTLESRISRDPLTAVCVRSPDVEIEQDTQRWSEAEAYVADFFSRYKDDPRLLAIEIMNEPHRQRGNLPFAKRMTQYAHQIRGSIPLTIGCMRLEDNLCFADEIDIYQFHHNFPTSVEELHQLLSGAKAVQDISQKPCWITEWQRIRSTGPGWDAAQIPDEDKAPLLSSMAATIKESGLGNFFWSLMVKPAYLSTQRPNGTFNGLFHEDGSVYSREDYLSIAENTDAPEEKRSQPEWYLRDLDRMRAGLAIEE